MQTGSAAGATEGSVLILSDKLYEIVSEILKGNSVDLTKFVSRPEDIQEIAQAFGVSPRPLLAADLYDDVLHALQQVEGIFLRNVAVALPGQVAQYYDAMVSLVTAELKERQIDGVIIDALREKTQRKA